VRECVVPELVAVTRRLDYVLRLERDGEVYLRHIEFEMRYRKGLALRMLEYGAALAARYKLPVASTVIVVRGGAPRFLLHEERVGGRWVCLRRIGVVRLCAMKPAEVLCLGAGGAALAGLVGPPDTRVLRKAAQRIRIEAPADNVPDLLTILRKLSDGLYTASELEAVVPREVVMGSSLFATMERRIRAEAWAKGATDDARLLCTELVGQFHPSVVSSLTPVLDACDDVERLRRWALAAPRATDAELVRMVVGDGTKNLGKARAGRPAATRVARPARRAKAVRG
jgi:hypothetical protein